MKTLTKILFLLIISIVKPFEENKHFVKIVNDILDIIKQSVLWYKDLTRKQQAMLSVVILLVLLGGVRAFLSGAKKSEDTPSLRTVTLEPLSSLTGGSTDLPLLGMVSSIHEATIRSETSGKVTALYRKLGDYVTAGQIIGQFENSSERASLQQAEGAYDAAKAARDIAELSSGLTTSSLFDTKTSALNAISLTYTVLDDAIRVKTDQAFSNPRSQEAKLLVTAPDAGLVTSIEFKRRSLENLLIVREQKIKQLTQSSDLVLELTLAQTDLQTVKSYLDDLALLYAKAIPDGTFSQSSLIASQNTITQVRTTLSGTVSSVTGAKTALLNSQTAKEIAGKTVTANQATIGAADATVKQALGAYNQALSRLEKTIIRSPITGTINSLSINTGDYITSFSPVAIISNNSALEVTSYVTSEDARYFSKGDTVTIDSTKGKGIITSIAEAIDPITKKIEITVAITEGQSNLTNGQSVHLLVTKTMTTKKQSLSFSPITIPLSALKITPKGSFVFSLHSDGTLRALPVETGAILGDRIQVLTKLDKTLSIIRDARGLKDKEKVLVK